MNVLEELYFITPPYGGVCYSAPAQTRKRAWRNWCALMRDNGEPDELPPVVYHYCKRSWYRSGYRCRKLKVCDG